MAGTCAAASGPPFFGLEPRALVITTMLIAATPFFLVFVLPRIFFGFGAATGWLLRNKTDGHRQQVLALLDEEAPERIETEGPMKGRRILGTSHDTTKRRPLRRPGSAKDWDGIIGFFHPFCNAGGGGERVLWAAVRATQSKWPRAKCVVYTGDHEASKDDILERVKSRFNILLHPPTISFLYLSKRDWVLASSWPRFTLLGQSLSSLYLAWDAFTLLVPDILVDTIGFSFALGLCKFLFPSVPTAAYVHYPTISTDMLDSLDPTTTVGSQGINAGQGVGVRGKIKRAYWHWFARLYSRVGASIDIVMTNSSWTQAHIESLWGPRRRQLAKPSPITVVYPPVAVEELEREIELSEASERRREPTLIYLAQFRPEKNQQLILQAFARFLKTKTAATKDARLALIGSVRDDMDSKVYQLRLEANELGIRDRVEFCLDVPWPEILNWLRRASVGVNGMWNEHFGIGVVEYQAAGLISVVHDSGGPKLDIVFDYDGGLTGFHASTAEEFAIGFEKALAHPKPLEVRKRARASSKRFTEGAFAEKWAVEMGRLIDLHLA